jgi:hypothetical protein
MTVIKKIPVLWGGLSNLPGYSLFYSSASTDVTTDLATFFTAIKALFPSGLTWNIPSSGDTVEDSTGAIVGSWTGTSAQVSGSGGALAYAAGSGAYTVWGTSLIIGRRRLKGRTFLCPVLSSTYSTGGQIVPTAITTLTNAASTLVTASKLVLWHRPTKTAPASGLSGLIVTSAVPATVTSLKSRRH